MVDGSALPWLIVTAQNVTRNAARIAMRACRPVDASLLAMTSLEGFTVKEAAAVLNISESAAKMRLTRLRAHLRAAVGADVITEEG